MFSNRMRMTGFSGLDVGDMVNQMMRAEAMRLDRLRQNRDLNVWRQNMMRDVGTNIRSFEQTWLRVGATRDIRDDRNLSALRADITNISGAVARGVTINADNRATPGTYRLHVHQTAQSDLFRTQGNHMGQTLVSSGVSFAGVFSLDGSARQQAQAAFNAANTAYNAATTALNEANAYFDNWLDNNPGLGPGDEEYDTLRAALNDLIATRDTRYTEREAAQAALDAANAAPLDLGVLGTNMRFTVNGSTQAVNLTAQQIENMLTPAQRDILRDALNSLPQLTSDFNRYDGLFEDREGLQDAITAAQNALDNSPYPPGSPQRTALEAALAQAQTEYDDHVAEYGTTYDLEYARDNAEDALTAVQDARDTVFEELQPAFAQLLNERLGAVFGHNAAVSTQDPGAQRVSAEYISGQGITFSASAGNTMNILNGQAGAGAVSMTLVSLGLSENPTDSVTTQFDPRTDRLGDFLGIDIGDNVIFYINNQRFHFVYGQDSSAAGSMRADTVQDVMNAINNRVGANVRMTFSAQQGQFEMSGLQMGDTAGITFDVPAASDGDFLSRIFFADSTSSITDPADVAAAGIRIMEARDSIIEFHMEGTPPRTFSRQTNSFDIDGIQIALTAAANGETFSFDLQQDTTAVETFLRDFVSAYNEMLQSIIDLSETRRPRQEGGRGFFMPLTQDERRAMSEHEIQTWEEQARSGILHRDHTLRRVMDDLTAALFMNVEMQDGTQFNLMNMGIRLSRDVTEFGLLEIDEDIFEYALQNHSESIAELFTRRPAALGTFEEGTGTTPRWQRIADGGIGDRLNDILGEWGWHMHPITGSITQRAGISGSMSDDENDFSSLIREQNRRIDSMLEWLQRREDQLFRQFSRLEMASMQANSQMMFFDQMFWGGM